MRQEIRVELKLDRNEAALLDHHSLLNLFNVLEAQLSRIMQAIPGTGLRQYTNFCLEVLVHLPRTRIQELTPEMMDHCSRLKARIRDLLDHHPDQALLLNGVLDIIRIGHLRLEEYTMDRFAWQETDPQQFKENLEVFLQATSRVSGNRFTVAFTPEPPRGDAYWIDFRIETNGHPLMAPPVLHDTIRDLVGNARKYSPPGSRIGIQLASPAPGQLQLRVEDEGVGIPEEEIDKVVRFGYRATNVLDRRTMGGGFGLTKAYNVCRRYGGRFFIESGIGEGTSIEMTLSDAI